MSKNYDFIKKNICFSFFSLIHFIFLILVIFFSINVFNSEFINDKITPSLPIKIQEQRAFFLMSLSVFFVITIFSFYLYWEKKPFEKNILNIFLPLVSFFGWVYFINLIIRKKELIEFIKDEFLKESCFKIYFWDKGKTSKEQLTIKTNTFFSLFQLLITLVSFVLMLSTKEIYLDIPSPNESLMLGTYSYFTEISNIATFVFVFLLLLTGHRFFFKNNSFLLAIISYISITGIAFNLALGFTITFYYTPFDNTFDTVKSVWFHIVNPITFVIYGSYVLFISKQKMNKNYSFFVYSSILPTIYAFYVYSLPFFTNVSIYGFATNLNKNIVPYFGSDDPNFYNGGWQSSFFILGGFFLFLFTFIISKFLLMKNIKKWENH